MSGKKHGGKRNGAGRKKKAPTIVIRIPADFADKVKELIGKISVSDPFYKKQN